jgi:hypothetical protein
MLAYVEIYNLLVKNTNRPIIKKNLEYTSATKHNRSLKVAVKGLDFMVNPLYIHQVLIKQFDLK